MCSKFLTCGCNSTIRYDIICERSQLIVRVLNFVNMHCFTVIRSKCDLLFLFEKKLAPTDCDVKAGRFLLPKQCAEQYFPQFAGSQSMPLSIEDREGRSWLFVLRWWMYKKSRKYVLDGTRKCIEIMRWNMGDTMKFYRRVADGKLIFELQRTLAATPASNVPVPGDGVRNP